MQVSVQKAQLGEKILAIHSSNDVYIGLGSKFINHTKQRVLCVYEKSVRSIASNEQFIGSCSYDGTAMVFDAAEMKFRDKIEGPDTEIKGLAFHDDFIAITTRGKTTWILENFEISKILEDHTQDVKGCRFIDGRLYTWSYDCTICVYDLFELDHSWVLSQSIDLKDIIWNVVFYEGHLCAVLQNGSLVILSLEGYFWKITRILKVSLTAVHCILNFEGYLGMVCNRNALLVLDSNFEKVCEIPDLNDGCDVFSCDYHSKSKTILFGSEDGTLTEVSILS